MKDVRIHDVEKNALMSIKVDSQLEFDNLLRATVLDLFNRSERLNITARHPYSDNHKVFKDLKMNQLNFHINFIDMNESSGSIDCSYGSKELGGSFLETLLKIWRSNSRVAILFTLEEYKKNKLFSDLKTQYWGALVELYQSYLIYKDTEEYVLWLTKSINLEFPPFS